MRGAPSSLTARLLLQCARSTVPYISVCIEHYFISSTILVLQHYLPHSANQYVAYLSRRSDMASTNENNAVV